MWEMVSRRDRSGSGARRESVCAAKPFCHRLYRRDSNVEFKAGAFGSVILLCVLCFLCDLCAKQQNSVECSAVNNLRHGPFRTLRPNRPRTPRRADHCGNGGEWRRYGLRHHRPIRPAPLRPQCRTGRSPAQRDHADTDGRKRMATLSVTITPPATSSRASAK